MTTTTFASINIPGKGLAMVINGKTYNVDVSHPNYAKIIKAVNEKQYASIPLLTDVAKAITSQSKGLLVVNPTTGDALYNGSVIHNSVLPRIVRHFAEGLDIKPLLNFLNRVLTNPVKNIQHDIYQFCEAGAMPITEDGYIIALKSVNENYTSIHDGKTDNSIGTKPSVPFEQCDLNRDQTCSYGLHFCSHEYLKHFPGKRIVILKIDPANITAIPSDYNQTKGRATTYEVIGELDDADRERAYGDTRVLPTTIYKLEIEEPTVTAPTGADGQWPFGDVSYPFPTGNLPSALPVDVNGLDDPKVDVKKVVAKTKAAIAKKAPAKVQPVVAIPAVSKDYQRGYVDGYPDGRKGIKRVSFNKPAQYKLGYVAGNDDGRGHKKRLYK